MSKNKKIYKNPLLAQEWEPVMPDLFIVSKAGADKQNLKIMIEKYKALHEHYGVNPLDRDSQTKLLVALMGDHVPGFRVATKKKRGRPQKWHGHQGLELFYEIYSHAQKSGRSYLWACHRMARKGKYTKYAPDTLYARFKEVSLKHPAAPLMQALLKKTENKTIYPS